MILHVICPLDGLRQRLFQEITIRRCLSHPNILPVLGVSQELVPLRVVTERMTDGNIVDFTSGHPEVNRLCLVRPISVFPLNPHILRHSQSLRKQQPDCNTYIRWVSYTTTPSPYVSPTISTDCR